MSRNVIATPIKLLNELTKRVATAATLASNLEEALYSIEYDIAVLKGSDVRPRSGSEMTPKMKLIHDFLMDNQAHTTEEIIKATANPPFLFTKKAVFTYINRLRNFYRDNCLSWNIIKDDRGYMLYRDTSKD